MPQKVICSKCGYILYEGMELKTPDEILQQYEERCPKCGRKLSIHPVKILIDRSTEQKGVSKKG